MQDCNKRFRNMLLGDASPAEGVLTWGLASFHAAALGYSGVLYLWLSEELAGFFGDPGDEVSSLLGLAAFAVFWAASLIGTVRSLPASVANRLALTPPRLLVGAGSWGGMVAGLAFLAIAAVASSVVGALVVTLEGDPENAAVIVAIAMLALAFGSFFAGAVGLMLGTIVGVVDLLLLAVADWIVGPLPPNAPEDAETPAT